MEFTQQEFEKTIQNYTLSTNPIVLKQFPVKEKRKFILLTLIVKSFEHNVIYSEKQINEILKPIYHDFATIRRYLVDYKFLNRNATGESYWLI